MEDEVTSAEGWTEGEPETHAITIVFGGPELEAAKAAMALSQLIEAATQELQERIPEATIEWSVTR